MKNYPRYALLAWDKDGKYWYTLHYGTQMEDMNAQRLRYKEKNPDLHLEVFISVREIDTDDARKRNKSIFDDMLSTLKGKK